MKKLIKFDTRTPEGDIIERDIVVKCFTNDGNILANDSEGVECIYPSLDHPMITNVRVSEGD